MIKNIEGTILKVAGSPDSQDTLSCFAAPIISTMAGWARSILLGSYDHHTDRTMKSEIQIMCRYAQNVLRGLGNDISVSPVYGAEYAETEAPVPDLPDIGIPVFDPSDIQEDDEPEKLCDLPLGVKIGGATYTYDYEQIYRICIENAWCRKHFEEAVRNA